MLIPIHWFLAIYAKTGGGVDLLTLTGRTTNSKVLGAVGIGTDRPEEKLHIRGNIALEYGLDESDGPGNYISFLTKDNNNEFSGLMYIKERFNHQGLMLFSHYYNEYGDPEPYMYQTAPALYVETSENSNRDYIGLNMTYPQQRLHVAGNILITRDLMGHDNPGNRNGSIMFGDVVDNNQNPFGHYAIGYVNEGTQRRGLNFWKPYNTNTGGTLNYVLFLSSAQNTMGNVGIGTNNPTHKLTVNGKIKATEIIVRRDNTEEWPDYVFSPDYTLTSLTDLEEYVTTNKHLPGIPTAQEIKDNGVELGEMNAMLLEKVEQLTLYIIEQQKQIDALKSQMKTNECYEE